MRGKEGASLGQGGGRTDLKRICILTSNICSIILVLVICLAIEHS